MWLNLCVWCRLNVVIYIYIEMLVCWVGSIVISGLVIGVISSVVSSCSGLCLISEVNRWLFELLLYRV